MAKEIIRNDNNIKDYVIKQNDKHRKKLIKFLYRMMFIFVFFCFCHEWVTICKWRVSDECAVFIAGI